MFSSRTYFLPGNIPFEKKSDLICLLDVREHIQDNEIAVSSLRSLLKPGGRTVITVPAYQWMFGRHDTLLHHFRHCSRKRLEVIFSNNNIEIEKLSYFNTLMLPIAIMAHITDTVTAGEKCTGYETPAKWINYLFYQVFRLERFVICKLNPPFGCSLLLISKPIS